MSEIRIHSNVTPREAFMFAVAAGGAIIAVLTLMMLVAIHNKRVAMSELRSVIAQVDNRRDQSPSGLDQGRLYVGDTPQLAQVALQTDIQKLAERFEIGIDVVRADTIEQVGPFIQLGLVFTGAIPEASVGPFFEALGNQERLIVVDQISLRPARSSRSEATQRRIAFQLKLFGYYR
ncbi:MAG: GspMb/PilO family protein [Pseudomonadota bacterium]